MQDRYDPRGDCVPTIHLLLAPTAGERIIGQRMDESGGSIHPPRKLYVYEPRNLGIEPRIIAAEDCKSAYVPLCCYAPPTAEKAHKLYAAYNLGGPIERAGRSWDGRLVPTWDELLTRAEKGDAGAVGVVAKWRAVAEQADLIL